MNAEENIHTFMVFIFVVGVAAVVICGVIALFLYGGNDFTEFRALLLIVIIPGGILLVVLILEMALGLLHSLYGIRENLKKVDEDIQHFSDLYVENIVASRRENERERRRD